ncbi:MAG: hypothetical protein JRF59_01760 [Deltaproteobacteria bacterium]|nr:hypothetical protein [Deltaproteobacteria bacterium]MBW1925029.1 hypothetical protein [Deltaproteobacteria bacterium]MBW1950164.1 hypothetical protein [Deltaproteobacteria bacterium]MBW2009884.1 hypothetical protein [Deltaproteobacteria bacterium]MBW2102894.1 hypothetical protein [Deltaproteobacteria bacterium]
MRLLTAVPWRIAGDRGGLLIPTQGGYAMNDNIQERIQQVLRALDELRGHL